MSPPALATLWIGEALGRLERACLRSVVRQGHPLTLYCYSEPRGVPEGVRLRDAAAVLPESAVIRHRSGSVSLFSNRFRYELQRQALGIWIDTDAYLLAPLPGDRPHLFGRYEPALIASGILGLPADSPMVADLLEPFEERTVPAWLNRRDRLRAWWRLRRTGSTSLPDMPWGTAGPHAVTAVARRHGLDGHALDPEVLYPTHWREARWVIDPAIALEDVTTPRTVSVHLYNEMIKAFKEQPAPPGSFLARLQAEGE